MTTYYIYYGEPPRRPRWVYFVLGMATLAAALAVVAAFLTLPLLDKPSSAENAETAAPALNEPAPAEAWYAAIAGATVETAITYYLVDTSKSMDRELPNAMKGLNGIIASKSPGSRVGVIAFGDNCKHPLRLLELTPAIVELAERGDLIEMEIGMAGVGTDVSCAFEQALAELQPLAEQGNATEVVLFSDGDLAAVVEPKCNSGDVVQSTSTQEGSHLFMCRGGWSHEPMPIIEQFSDAGIIINGIYFQPHRYDWADQVEVLTEATEGEFVDVRAHAAGRAMR